MYAIVETGGKQYRVQLGDTVAVERLSGEPGETLDLQRVLLVGGTGESPRVGSPGVDGAVVRAEVLEHFRGAKIVVFRYKSKVRYRRKTGHRQSLTRLRIQDIVLDGESAAERAEASVAVPVATTAPAVASTETPVPAAAEEVALPASAGEAGPEPEEDDTSRA